METPFLIAIDTEYHTNEIGQIDNVYCVCATASNGKTFKKWTSGAKDEFILDEIRAAVGADAVCYFVCHAYDKAERRAFKFLGDTTKQRWLDTYHLARMIRFTFSRAAKETPETEEEAILLHEATKKAEAGALSYAGLCKSLNIALVDTQHKQLMRSLCITGEVAGSEEAILNYCLSDTAQLIPLFNALLVHYLRFIQTSGGVAASYCPITGGRLQITKANVLTFLCEQCADIKRFGDIADRGLPLSADRVELIKKAAPLYKEQLKAAFNDKWHIYKPNKRGVLHESSEQTQARLYEQIRNLHIEGYPRSAKTLKLSCAGSTLKDYFTEGFGAEYRQHMKLLKQISGISKKDDNPLNYYKGGVLYYDTLNPYATITSRCAPSTKRFLFGWHKSLYGLFEPPAGKWLVELDFGSEETFCQCAICRDSQYNEIYNSKDIYLAFAAAIGMIDRADFATLPTAQLKEKYKAERKRIKPMILGLSYGMGAAKLASRCGMSESEAEETRNNILNSISITTKWKANLDLNLYACKSISLPDGFICRYDRKTANRTSLGNWAFQSAGGYILRKVIKRLEAMQIDTRATIHDAIFFMIDEGDNETIQKVAEVMRSVANACLQAPAGWSMKVGAPEIIKHGEIWTPEHAFDNEFKALLAFAETVKE